MAEQTLVETDGQDLQNQPDQSKVSPSSAAPIKPLLKTVPDSHPYDEAIHETMLAHEQNVASNNYHQVKPEEETPLQPSGVRGEVNPASPTSGPDIPPLKRDNETPPTPTLSKEQIDALSAEIRKNSPKPFSDHGYNQTELNGIPQKYTVPVNAATPASKDIVNRVLSFFMKKSS